jgi:maltose O-acetyltransferase
MKKLSLIIWTAFNQIQSTAFMSKRVRNFLLRALGCSIDKTASISERGYFGSNKLTVENNVVVNIGVFLDGSANIFIGEYARLGPFVRILTGSHVYANDVLRRGPKSTEDLDLPVRVERGCWLGMGTMVLPGVTIAEGCVVAAGTLINKSTAPNGLYAGVPAKRVRDLPVEL